MSISPRGKKFLKVLGINFAILTIFIISPALLFRFYLNFKPRFYRSLNQTSDKRAYYPTYDNKKFSIKVFNELQKLSYDYRSFIGWRRGKVNFKYTNVLGTYNTRKSLGEEINDSVWFFGGSTMWGNGVSDYQTIPSYFNSLTNNPVYNFGEGGWNSRQSLNQLISVIGDNQKPSVIIFYDGFNDVYHQCRREIQLLPSHDYEIKLQNALKAQPIQYRFFQFILSPYIPIANKFRIQLPVVRQANLNKFDCHTNPAKARAIAQHLVNNWKTAYLLSKSNNFDFYGILQPTLFTTKKTNSEYFATKDTNTNSSLEIQFSSVYPIILEEINRQCEFNNDFCSSIIDGKDWLEGTENVFIDSCHVNSMGNKIIAKRMQSLLKNK